MHPPHVPEIRLHLASEAVPLWQRTEEELGEMGLPPPFWAFAWAGGQALARYLLDTPDVVSNKSCLDFAAGSGLVGIAARLAGASQVTCADIDAFAAEGGERHLNRDGWGIMFAEERDAHVFREASPAARSPLARMVVEREVACRHLIAHVRRASRGRPLLASSSTTPR